MKILDAMALSAAILLLIGCSEKAEENSEFRHFPTIKRTFSTSQSSGNTGQGDNLQAKIANANSTDTKLWKKLEDERNSLEPIFLLYLAEHVVATNERKAIEWYWLGLIRAQLDASLCTDSTANSSMGFVSALAPNVLHVMRLDQEKTAKIAQKVLKRRDLRNSSASPWWICSHGAKSLVNSLQNRLAAQMSKEEASAIGIDKTSLPKESEAEWLIPEDQMAARYESVISQYKDTFSQMLKAFQDPVDMSPAPLFPAPIIDNEAVDEFFWIDSNTLAILRGGRENEVYLRDSKNEPTQLIKRDFPLEFCASPARLMVNSNDLEMTQFKKSWRQDFISWSFNGGNVKPEGNVTRSFDNAPIYARQQVGTRNLNSSDSARHKQSSLSCNWLDESELGQFSQQVSNWTDIGPFPGYLITFKNSSKYEKGTYYLQKPNTKPRKISDALLPLDCMRYIRHRNAILANACVTGNSGSLRDRYGWDAGSMVWLEMDQGQIKVNSVETLKHPSQKSSSQIIPTKAGIVRLVRNFETPNGPRPGGLYMETSNRTLQKIWKGWIEKAELSPDGCSIAFTANYRANRNVYTGETNKLYTANICDYRSQPAG